jgi:hypothetical protein
MAGIAYNEKNPPQVDQRIMQTGKKAPNPVRFVSRSQSEKLVRKMDSRFTTAMLAGIVQKASTA